MEVSLEVEVKYALSDEDFKRISVAFALSHADNLFKKDSYYTRYPSKKKALAKGEPLIRIREENGKSFLTIKNKSKDGNFEVNKEQETEVEDITVVRNLLLSTGYREYFYKEKDAWSMYENVTLEDGTKVNVHSELEIVNGRFRYLEIEVTDDITKEQAMEALGYVCQSRSVTDDMIDMRSWPEILGIKV